jgi:hypothetical protein
MSMRLRHRYGISLLSLLLAVGSAVGANPPAPTPSKTQRASSPGLTAADTAESPPYPPYVTPGGATRLNLVGSAVLQRNFVPFYSGALYAPLSVRTTEQLLSGLSPCRIHVVWAMPELNRDAVQDYWLKAMQAAAGDRFAGVRAQTERLAQSMPAVKRGQSVIFDYVPDSGMSVLVDDKPVAQLAGVQFNKTLLAVWLGGGAPSDFRDALTAGLRRK